MGCTAVPRSGRSRRAAARGPTRCTTAPRLAWSSAPRCSRAEKDRKEAQMPEFPESIGPYKVLAKVGEGSMGVVYKAHDTRLDRVVALKMIRELQSDPGRRRRMWQEARVAAQVSHPNACRLYDLVEDHD